MPLVARGYDVLAEHAARVRLPALPVHGDDVDPRRTFRTSRGDGMTRVARRRPRDPSTGQLRQAGDTAPRRCSRRWKSDTPEEHQRRGDTADALLREMKRWIAAPLKKLGGSA
jgi:hypothetical protein